MCLYSIHVNINCVCIGPTRVHQGKATAALMASEHRRTAADSSKSNFSTLSDQISDSILKKAEKEGRRTTILKASEMKKLSYLCKERRGDRFTHVQNRGSIIQDTPLMLKELSHGEEDDEDVENSAMEEK